MAYKQQKPILILFIITVVNFYCYGCSQESQREAVKEQPETVQVQETYDFLDNLRNADIIAENEDYVRVIKRRFSINYEPRLVLSEYPNSEILFKDVPINDNAELKFGIGIDPAMWDKGGDGVLFEITTIDEKSQRNVIFSRYIDPKNNVDDRNWFDSRLDLKAFAGQKISFIFKTTGGPKGNTVADWAVWSSPELTSIVEKVLDDYPISLEKTKYDLMEEFRRAGIITQNTSFATGIKKSRIRVNNYHYKEDSEEEREVILAYPPSEFRYRFTIPDKAILEFGIGVAAGSVDKDVKFEVYLNKDKIFSRYITNRKKDMHWFDEKIDLSKYGGKKVNLSFKTLHQRQNQNNNSPVMAGWSNLRIIEVIPVKRNLSGKDHPNIILMVVDTLRADHLTCYGYHRDTSPALNKFAQEGILFENAISQSSWTWPATATILTGLYPYTHGVTHGERSFLANSIITLPEILQENHLTTVGLSANPLISKDKNFSQGFETFIEMPWAGAEAINNRILDWLDRNKDLQFFAYLHYMDPHDPYSAPGKYYDMFDPGYKGKYNFRKRDDVNDVNVLWKAINFNEGDVEYTERDIGHLAALYDGEIRYWDSQFSALLKRLKKLNILDKTIIVVTSDHGEEFLDHGKLKHGQHLYDESIRVPLIIWSPEMMEGGRKEEQVETVDIYPTLCKILGIEIPKDFQGESLFPWTEVKSANRYAYSLGGYSVEDRKTSVRTKEWKLVFTHADNKYELYSLQQDKGEKNNLFGKHSIEDELRSKLEQWVLTTKKHIPEEDRQGINKETMEKLRSLGYVQ